MVDTGMEAFLEKDDSELEVMHLSIKVCSSILD